MKKHLFIVHGWAYDVSPWNKTISYLEEAGIKVTMLNVPGLTQPSTKVFTMNDYVEWADEHLPDGAVALGHSNGGRILMNLAIKHPAKLSHLILLDAAGVRERNLMRDSLRVASKVMSPFKKSPKLRKLFHKFIGANDYERAPENMKKTMSNMLDSDKSLEPAKIKTPTTIIWGDADTITPPRQARKLLRLIKNSSLDMYQSWGHAAYKTHPREVAQAIVKALGEIK